MRQIKAWIKDERVRAWTEILLGCVIAAAAYPLFLTENNIAPGGLTGVAIILNYLTGSPVGITSLALAIPLFLVGWRQIGMRFVLRSVVATGLFSVLIDLLPFPCLTDDILLATLFGAVLLGIGLALILRGGATTGGTDMLAEMLHRRFPSIKVGAFLMLCYGCVVLAAWFTVSSRAALYALINIFICARVIDIVLAGWGNAKACFIISDHADRITKRIMDELERGVTLLESMGAYSGTRRQMILCVCGNREIVKEKQILREEDLRAFLFITDTHETLGEGFQALEGEQ
ncbi:MAG: YitT family protein [Clostridia bacterium]|nr:YitT family protein [Clostridia bacterium]